MGNIRSFQPCFSSHSRTGPRHTVGQKSHFNHIVCDNSDLHISQEGWNNHVNGNVFFSQLYLSGKRDKWTHICMYLHLHIYINMYTYILRLYLYTIDLTRIIETWNIFPTFLDFSIRRSGNWKRCWSSCRRQSVGFTFIWCLEGKRIPPGEALKFGEILSSQA